MTEKVLNNKKNGMAMLLLFGLLYAAAIGLTVRGGIGMDNHLLWAIPVFVVGVIWICVGWIPFMGLKVLKPQEALVLTLFGRYVGTLKNEGFYFVNPFCSGVNPAAKTKLGQSGDVDGGRSGNAVLNLAISGSAGAAAAESASKKISLKVMTLSNSRQKINDCLGNPIEISIAVMWRVVDTAEAGFNVDT